MSQRERAAQDRVERALEYLPQAQAAKQRQQQTLATAKRAKATAPRVSSRDPQARVMKMPHGGYRPACNIELATDQAKRIIVGSGEGYGAISYDPIYLVVLIDREGE